MRINRLIGLVIAGGWLLAACSSPAVQTTSTPGQIENTTAPTFTSAPTVTVGLVPSATPEATATNEAAAESAPVGGVSFTSTVLPMLTKSCLNCHGGNKTEEGLSFKTYESLMAGSNKGPVVVAGDAANSFIVEVIASGDMPKRGTKWTADQLQVLIDWINQGALNN